MLRLRSILNFCEIIFRISWLCRPVASGGSLGSDERPFEMRNFLKIRIINLYCNTDIDVAKLVGTLTIFTILHVGTITIFTILDLVGSVQ